MRIVGLVGRANTGKSTVAKYLSKYGYYEICFASALKDYVAKKYNLNREMLNGDTDESRIWREEYILDCGITPRKLLQKVGNGKRAKDPDYWVKKININDIDKFVISDCRFANELEFIKSIPNSITIKLVRPNNSIYFEVELYY